MKCPLCKSELEPGEQLPLETTYEHVMLMEPVKKDSFWCINPDCELSGKLVCWNSYGELYVTGDFQEYLKIKEQLDGNTAPFGSFQRKAWVEIEKNDEDIWIDLPFKWKVQVDWKYKADNDGNVLSRRPKLVLVHDHVVYQSKLGLLFFLLSHPSFFNEKPHSGSSWHRKAAYSILHALGKIKA